MSSTEAKMDSSIKIFGIFCLKLSFENLEEYFKYEHKITNIPIDFPIAQD
jgi:hypothetical protein